MGCLRRFIKVFLAVFLISAVPGVSPATDLGLTPNHVFSIWTNINHSLLAYAETVSDDDAWIGSLSAMRVRTFTGKKPKDVFAKARELRARLKPFIPIVEKLPDWLKSFRPAGRRETGNTEVTPSEVFLLSARILEGIVGELVGRTGSDLLISTFYVEYRSSGKTPSDVFALVDLAARRSERIVARAKAA